MPETNDVFIGKIALNRRMITQDQLDDCVCFQERSSSPKPLGAIMVLKGYITGEQLKELLKEQEKILSHRTRSHLFGKIVLKLRLATLDQVNECLRIQAKMENDLPMRLGEIMLRKGYLTKEEVERVLREQRKTVLTCASCKSQFNVVDYREGVSVRCTKCGEPLQMPDRLQFVSADETVDMEELDTL